MLNIILKELRKKKKISQKELSEILGIAQTTYAGYETGRHQPNLEILIKLSEFYSVSLDYITGRYK